MMNHEQIKSLIQIHKRIALDHIKLADELHDQLATAPAAPAAAPATGQRDIPRTLTRREKQVLSILQENRQAPATIAGRLGLSSANVHHLMTRLRSQGIDIQKKTVATQKHRKGYYKIYWVDQKKQA